MSEHKRAVIELVGATCTSCALGIEHMGSRLEGVTDVHVDRGKSVVYVDYTGDVLAIEKICDFVHRIGYQAHVVHSG